MLLGAAALLLLVPSMEIFAVETVVLSFAVLYGFAVWPVGRTIGSLSAFVAFAGAVMYPRTVAGQLPSAELVEVVVPLVLAGTVIYHVRRREAAIHQAAALAAADRRRAAARERLSRMTSHELRTPLTIAAGYVEHLLADEPAGDRREDLLTVRDELDQLTRVGERLLRTVALDLGAPEQQTELAPLFDDMRRRWSVVADRELVIDCRVATVSVHADRLRAALDTLVENSVRYTRDGDRIRLFATRIGDRVEVGVADAGSGLSPGLVSLVNAGVDQVGSPDLDPAGPRPPVSSPEGLRDLYSRTGYGLRIVASIAQSAGGRLTASRAPEGGACLVLSIPAVPPATDYDTTRVTEVVRATPDQVPVRTSP